MKNNKENTKENNERIDGMIYHIITPFYVNFNMYWLRKIWFIYELLSSLWPLQLSYIGTWGRKQQEFHDFNESAWGYLSHFIYTSLLFTYPRTMFLIRMESYWCILYTICRLRCRTGARNVFYVRTTLYTVLLPQTRTTYRQ